MKHKEKKPHGRRLHQDWRVWVAVGLMLAAMGMYVFSLDESVQPGGAANDNVPINTRDAGPSK